MSSRVPPRPTLRNLLTRTLTSIAAIAAVCVIFAVKAAEGERLAAAPYSDAALIAH